MQIAVGCFALVDVAAVRSRCSTVALHAVGVALHVGPAVRKAQSAKRNGRRVPKLHDTIRLRYKALHPAASKATDWSSLVKRTHILPTLRFDIYSSVLW